MVDSELSPAGRPSRLWITAGVALVVVGLGADYLGIGDRHAVGRGQLLALVVGVVLVARSAWVDAAPIRAAQCVMVWAWAGLAAGYVDVAFKTSGPFTLQQPAGYFWIIPATCAVAFAAVGAVWAIAGRVVPKGHTLPGVVLVAAAVGVAAVIRLIPSLDEAVSLLVALAVGTALARLAAARPAGWLRTCGVTTMLMVTSVIAAGVWQVVHAAAQERRVLDGLVPAPADAKNVLLIVLDTVRGDHLGVHGYERDTTPAIDRLAAGGVAFDHAIASAPWTLPSHISLLTGRYPHETSGSFLRPLDDAHQTLAEVMTGHGYVTAGFVGNLAYCGAPNGIGRGFSRYVDYTASLGVLATSPALGFEIGRRVTGNVMLSWRRAGAVAVTDHFLQWLGETGDRGRPFFAFINYFDAHAYYDPPQGYDRFGPRTSTLNSFADRGWRWSAWSEADQQGFIDAYDGCLRFVDDQIGRLLGELEKRDLLDETLVVVTGDHGEQFGEHDLKGHTSSLYRPVLHVPMVVHLPGVVPAGKHYEDFVSIVDVPATVLDLVGIAPAEPLPGVSMAGAWAGDGRRLVASPVLSSVEKSIRRNPELPFSKGPMKSLFFDGLHYILGGDGREELYDARGDVAEEHDLSGSRPADLARLRVELARVLAARPGR